MNKLVLAVLLMFTGTVAQAKLGYNDCVQIQDDFYASPGTVLVGRVQAKRVVNGVTEYLIGNIFFGMWFPEKQLVKVNDSVCDEADESEQK